MGQLLRSGPSAHSVVGLHIVAQLHAFLHPGQTVCLFVGGDYQPHLFVGLYSATGETRLSTDSGSA